MATFIISLLSVSLCFAILYLIYKWAWNSDKNFAIRRLLLWFIPIVSVVIPLIPWDNLLQLIAKKGEFTENYDGIYGLNLMDVIITPIDKYSIDYLTLAVVLLYVAGIVIMVIFLLKELLKIILFVKNADNKRVLDCGVKLILIDRDIAPFSCFNYVVMSGTDYQNYKEEILTHELAHIHFKHVIDLVYINIIICLQWFNPAAWLLKREFQILHEYQADNAVLQHGINAQKYQLLLIKRSVGEQMFNLGNSFNYGHLKKRINMMLNKRSHKWLGAKLFLIVPVLLFMGIVFGCNNTQESTKNQKETIAQPEVIKSQKEPLDVAEVPPTFPDGMKGLMEYLSSNIKYPKEAQKEAVEGRVILRFVVDTDGSVKDVKVLKGVHELLDAEAIRVVESMPKWEPGKNAGEPVAVYFTLPISFKMTN